MARAAVRDRAHAVDWVDLAALLALALVTCNFIIEASLVHVRTAALFATPWGGFGLVVSVLAVIAGATRLLAVRAGRRPALVIVSPLALLAFWPAQDASQPLWIPVAIVAVTAVAFARVLRSEAAPLGRGAVPAIALAAAYFVTFTSIEFWKLKHFELFNPRDWAMYAQSFWTARHGRFFVNSIYPTSYFAAHSSVFFYLLLPFYYVFPGAGTLLTIKLLLLSVSVVPFRRIARDILGEEPPLALLAAFLLFPFIVTQNLNAPHEMGYAPFFLLWTYWFYRTRRFGWFVFFLVVTVSIKEHLTAIAFMFGVYAWWEARSRRWIAVPLVLGLVLAPLLLWFIVRMQQAYHAGEASWVMAGFRQRLAASSGNTMLRVVRAAVPATLTSWDSLQAFLLLIVPLGVVLPFLSPVWLLGAPEIALNLVIDRPAVFSPIWHYNVAASCFLLIAAVEGIRRVAGWRWFQRLGLAPKRAQRLLATAVCSLVLMHSYTWVRFVADTEPPLETAAVWQALATLPPDGFVTAPVRILPVLAERDRLTMIEEGQLGDYVVDDGAPLVSPVAAALAENYRVVFREDGISVYQRMR